MPSCMRMLLDVRSHVARLYMRGGTSVLVLTTFTLIFPFGSGCRVATCIISVLTILTCSQLFSVAPGATSYNNIYRFNIDACYVITPSLYLSYPQQHFLL